jgi:hypothetical protein
MGHQSRAVTRQLASRLMELVALAHQAQPTASGPSDKMTAEQVNDANVQLMREDIRAQRKRL